MVILSRHADNQLKERKISSKKVIEAVKNPTKVFLQSNNRYKAVKSMRRRNKKYLLVVIYDATDSDKEVVTAFITSKINKYL